MGMILEEKVNDVLEYYLIFWLCWIFVVLCRLLQLQRRGPLSGHDDAYTSHCMGFSWCEALALGCWLCSCAEGDQLSCSMWAPPGPESEPVTCIGRWTLPWSHQESPRMVFTTASDLNIQQFKNQKLLLISPELSGCIQSSCLEFCDLF